MPDLEIDLGDRKLQLARGDITNQPDLDAVVNAANAALMPGGGVAGAIHRAAGPRLAEACRSLAPINPGEAVITDGFNLPNRYVIHVLGPVFGSDEPSDKLLARGYERAFQLSEEHQLAAIGFPAISTGAFGYPIQPAARIALTTCIDALKGAEHVHTIRFVLFSTGDLEVHQRVLRELHP